MDNVTLDGVTYTKLSVLAKKYGYTTDYLGQLCRSDKIEAELVGRAWYANEASLKTHQAERYQDSSVGEKVTIRTPEVGNKNIVIRVEPRLSKRTLRQLDNQHNFAQHDKPVSHLRVSYDADESELAPQLTKPRDHTTSAIEPTADSRSHTIAVRDATAPATQPTTKTSAPTEEPVKLNISKESRSFDLSFTDLPSVSLRGSVTIKDLENEDYIDASIDTPITKPPRKVRAKLPHQVRVPIQSATKPTATQPSTPKHPAEHSRIATTGTQVIFSPHSVATPATTVSTRVPYVVSAGIALACVGVGVMLFTGSVYVVEGQVIASSWYLQLASLKEVFELLQSR